VKNLRSWFVMVLALCVLVSTTRLALCAEKTVKAAPVTKSADETSLEIEKLRLEKANLELEVEKLRLQAALNAATPVANQKLSKEEKKEALENFQLDYSKQAQVLAQQHKEEADLLLLDFVNSEIWFKGTRYGVHEWDSLCENQGWKLRKTLDVRAPNGQGRFIYNHQNISLSRYEGRKRGVLMLKAPSGEGDLRLMTPEGLSFVSTQEDVRNGFRNGTIVFDRQKKQGKGMLLRYVHPQKWQFADKLEISFDKDAKMSLIRYGVLDER
jgi:hypothetical protein